MNILRSLIIVATCLGLTLLAGCGEESVDDLDRIDAAPAAKVSADAIDPPADEPAIDPASTGGTEENRGY